MKKYLIILLSLLCYGISAKNLGHRAGGGKKEYYSHLPENSLTALEHSIEGIQYRKDFLYLEFDIQETKDGEIVIFHDKYIKRMISYKQNKLELDRIYDELGLSSSSRKRHKVKIQQLTFSQLRRLHLTDHPDQLVPTLSEFIRVSKQQGLIKPMTVELKYIRTDAAKVKVIEMLKEFNESYMKNADIIFEKKYNMPFRVGFLSFSSKFKKIFGLNKKWCKLIKASGLHGVFKARSHVNLCN
ncbi:hypothetical protein A9Q84_10920 [Halobacteriovorax marinus]|uniref:GP-PDE domain-containing protein n=1 Tax=Halobacteriovorax marinus TaxID=97084 RepID=A0A1Y5FBL0_9BACT|nr:hypothetical protein A9Q84_10920 [Halobacteriovorax marinus]